MCVHGCTVSVYIHVQVRGSRGESSFSVLSPTVWDKASHWTWHSSFGLQWLASDAQDLSATIPQGWTANMCGHTQLLYGCSATRPPSPFCCLFTKPQCWDCLIQEHLHGYILNTFSENAFKMLTGWGPVSKNKWTEDHEALSKQRFNQVFTSCHGNHIGNSPKDLL